jgi:hypothetical protein
MKRRPNAVPDHHRDMKREDATADPSVPCSRVIITVAEH